MIFKNLSYFKAVFFASLKADLEYRANFFMRVLIDVFWYLSQILTFEIIFNYSPNIGQWALPQMRFFLGVLFVIDALYTLLFHDNIDRISENIRKGELDFILTKPVSSQFLISLQRVSTAVISNLLLSLAWLIWASLQLQTLTVTRMLILLITIPFSLLLIYSLRFLIATLSLIFIRAENVQYLWYQIYRLGMRPDQIYPSWLRRILFTILPVGLVASLPTQIILGFASDWYLLLVIGLSYLFFKASQWFWAYALKHYSSASS